MKREAVKSSNLRSVGYDSASESLEIEFQTGSVYTYLHVPVAVYHSLMRAPSIGRYHAKVIVGHYKFQRG